MKLVVSCGLPGAGKEEFIYAVKECGLGFVRMGDVVREAHANRPDEFKDLSVGQLASKMRELEGTDCWARRAVERANGEVFVIDGCRSMDEIRMFRKYADEVIIIGIYASPKTRYERLVKRARDDAPANFQEFEERDAREIGWGSATAVCLSDIMIMNETSLERFHEEAKKVLGEVCGR